MSPQRSFSRSVRSTIILSCLSLATACGGTNESSSSAAGASSAGSPNAGAGSGGSGVAGANTSAGSETGGASGGLSPGGAGGTNAQAGASAGGTNGGGAAGTVNGGSGGGGSGSGLGGGGASGSAGGKAGASSAGSGGGSSSGFTLTSPAWTAMAGCAADNKTACPVFPKENIGTSIGGSNKSPELDWTAGPSGTQSYAIVLQDLTNVMNGKPFVHWALWNIPGATRMLPAGLETSAMPMVPAGSSQRSFSGNGYQGSGKCGNVYEFVLYALPTASFTPTGTNQTSVRDGLAATNAPTASLRAKSGAPGCTE